MVPPGLGVRREDESAVGQVVEGGPRPCGVEGESSVEVWGWYDVAYLIAKGRASFRRARPYCELDWQGARALVAYLIGRGFAPLLGGLVIFLHLLVAAKS